MSINHDSWMKQMAVNINASKWVVFTEKFILAILAIIIVVDLYLAFNNIEDDTISQVLQNWAYKRFPVITWAWGVLAGHLFLNRADPLFNSPNPIVVLVGLTAAIFLLGFFNTTILVLPVQVILLILGVLAGYLLWPQGPVT